jgi:hypothetical protein
VTGLGRILPVALLGLCSCALIAGLSHHHLEGDGGSDGAPPTLGQPIQLAQDQQSPSGIAVDETSVYWSNATQGMNMGTIAATAKTGGQAVRVIVSGHSPGGSVQVDMTNVYWNEGQRIDGAPKTGGGPGYTVVDVDDASFMCDNEGDVVALFVMGTVAYLSDACGDVGRVGTSTASPTVLAANQNTIADVVADASFVYFGDSTANAILRVNASAVRASPEMFAAAAAPGAMAIDDSTVYWISGNNVMKLDKSSPGQTPTVLAPAQNSPVGLAVDSASVYWTNAGAGTVMQLAKSGSGTAKPIATGQSQPEAITADEMGVYWIDTGNSSVWAALR